AERARCAARAPGAVLDAAGRCDRCAGPQCRGANPAAAGRVAFGGAEGAQSQLQPVLPGGGGERAARGAHLCAVQFPSRGEIRGLEGYRGQFQPAVHVPQLTSRRRNQETLVIMIENGPTLPRLLLSRRALLAGAAAASSAHIARRAAAAVRLDVTQGNIQPMPIALPDFVGGSPADTEGARGVTQVITADLRRSGVFAPIDPAAYIEKVVNIDAAPRFDDWRVINAQALVTGRLTRQGDGRLRAEFRLWDVFAGQPLIGQQYFTTPDNWRRIAHIISDAIYERLTGEKGYFDTRIVFIDETGPKERRIKRLAIMDQDGAGVRYLTRGDDLVLTPRFSPSTQEITYMSYGQG